MIKGKKEDKGKSSWWSYRE